MDLRNTRTTILNQGQATEKREQIRQCFHATYSLDAQRVAVDGNTDRGL